MSRDEIAEAPAPAAAAPAAEGVISDEKDIELNERKQDGVKQVEAITQAWTKKTLWITFGLLYFVSFMDLLMQGTQSNLTAYVTSAFSKHSLLSTTSIMSSIIGGVSKLTIAKIIDIWGRTEGFVLMIFLIVLGLIMKAACQNVETYAAAQTFYWVGHIGLGYIVRVMLADMTSLKNRMIIYGIDATPSLATIFAGPALAQAFYTGPGWRWAFGAFSIIIPAICVPVVANFIINHRKAKAFGLAPERFHGRTIWESVKHYVVEFDLLGMLLTTAGFALILLPFSLASSSADQWRSGYIIAMMVLGVVCLIAFVFWEKYFAPVQYFPFKYLKDRTILGACIGSFTLFISIYTWDIYFSSYLQVVNQLSIADAGYILNTYTLSSSFFSPFAGLLMRRTGKFKWLGLACIPFATLGTALLIYFRYPGASAGYMAMCQIFNGLAGGVLSMCFQAAVMASVGHQEVSVVLALYGLFASIGSAVGLAVSGAIWTNLLPQELTNRLPEGQKNLEAKIYGSLAVQLSYPWGSPVREAIVAAYGEVQRKMVIAGAAFMPLLFISVFVWKNLDLRKIEQTRGNVF